MPTGLPDAWEYSHFSHPTNGAPTGDDDGDGKTNAEEYQADTDPNSATSRLRIDSIIETSPGNFAITVPDTSPDRQYTLYESNDLGIADNWDPVPDQGPVSGNGGNLVFTPSSNTRKFYRVAVELP